MDHEKFKKSHTDVFDNKEYLSKTIWMNFDDNEWW